jgi:hypothetical protein
LPEDRRGRGRDGRPGGVEGQPERDVVAWEAWVKGWTAGQLPRQQAQRDSAARRKCAAARGVLPPARSRGRTGDGER